MAVSPEAGLQVIPLFLPLRCLHNLFWNLLQVIDSVCVDDSRAQDAVCILVAEVYDEKISFVVTLCCH